MKKILIRAPKGPLEIISTFPLIHKLEEIHKNAHIDIIADEEDKHFYNFYSGKIKIHGIPSNKNSIFSIHHYVMNKHEIFNIDIFYDLLGDFNSSFLGFSFKPKESYGYYHRLNRFLIKNRVTKKEYSSFDQKHSQFLKENLDAFKVKGELSLPQKENDFFKAYPKNSFFFLYGDNLEDSFEDRALWKEIVSGLDGEMIVAWPFKNVEEWQNIKNELSELNNFHLFSENDEKYLPALILKSKAVITTNFWVAALSNYYGVETIVLTSNVNKVPSIDSFELNPIVVDVQRGQVKKIYGITENVEVSSNDELTDFLHRFFRL